MMLQTYFSKEHLSRLRELVDTFDKDDRKYWKRELKKIRRTQWLAKMKRRLA